jgi:hypothetical protein
MKSRELKSLLNRVGAWPPGAQVEAEKALREIEEDFIIGPATRHELDVAHEEALRGEGISMDEVFDRYDDKA